MLGEDGRRARNVEPLPSVAVVTFALLEGTYLNFLDTELFERKAKLFFAADLGGMVTGVVRVVYEQCLLLICHLCHFLS